MHLLLAILVIVPMAAAQGPNLVAGPNVNMVSGTTFPDGDPFLQRQNEPSVAVSTRNTMNLMGFVNDYRAVDIPFQIDPKATGDAWLGVFKSFDGGQTWKSTLLPGYPQDLLETEPLWGYEAGADPVVRAGTHGLFYLSGIVFDRGEPAKSAVFVSRYMDLNNLEGGDPIEELGTTIVKANNTGDAFIDKPWLAVDIPRSGAQQVTLQVPQDGGFVEQTVECGNVYLAWAEITGVAPNHRSTIMFTRSEDCGQNWYPPTPLSETGTMNQGVTIAVSPYDGSVWVAWRQFNTTPPCTYTLDAGYWKESPEEWPELVYPFLLGGRLCDKNDLIDILHTPPAGGDARYILTHQLIPAILNFAYSPAGPEVGTWIQEAINWLSENPFSDVKPPKGKDKNEGLALKDQLETFNTTPEEGCIGQGGRQDAILVTQSVAGGVSFSTPPIEASLLNQFAQGTTAISFRTNSYPTMTVDHEGRAYLAWATRGLAIPRDDAVEGDARIVVSTSMDSTNWTTPSPIDQPGVEGHQIKPTITFGGGEIVIAYYDLRRDFSGVFERFIADWPNLPTFRHTVDVRAAHAEPGDDPEFTDYTSVTFPHSSDQVSRYAFTTNEPADPGVPEPLQLIQLQFNPPNLPIFVGGSKVFFGDYIDIATSPPFLPDGNGGWRYNTNPEDGRVFHAVWTDNRDVEAPHDGDWTNYVPPETEYSGGPSQIDPGEIVPDCEALPNGGGQTRIRNQNTYTARMSGGLYVSIPGSARPLGDFQRAFVVFVRNDSYEDKTFSLTIGDLPIGVEASFDQFETDHSLDVDIARYSSVARTVFVTSTDPEAVVQVNVTEIGGPNPVPLTRSVLINGDSSSPMPADSELLDAENYNLSLMNRAVVNLSLMNLSLMNDPTLLSLMNLSLMNPALVSDELIQLSLMNLSLMNLSLMNPSPENLSLMNLSLMNPAIYTLSLMNPALVTAAATNLSLMNLSLMNLSLMNPAVEVQEATWRVKNEGTATAGYSFNMIADDVPEQDFVFQLFAYRVYTTPVADGCELKEEMQHQMLVNDLDPEFLDPNNLDELSRFLDPETDDPAQSNMTFVIEPMGEVIVTLWIVDLAPDDDVVFTHEDVGAAAVAHAVNTDEVGSGSGGGGDDQQPFDSDFEFGPQQSVDPLVINPAILPNATVGMAYSYTLTATGGLGTRAWSFEPGSSVPAGLNLDTNGNLSWTPTAAGTYEITARVIDATQQATHLFSIDVVTGITGTPISWWTGDGSGEDSTGPNDATLNNGATYAPGLDGSAFSFDGTGVGGFGNYVDAPGTGIDNLEELTVSAWVQLNSLPPRIQRFITVEPPGSGRVVLGVDGTGPFPTYFVSMRIGGLDHVVQVDDVLQTGCFHHVAVTYDGVVMRAFLNGIEVGNASAVGILGNGTSTGVWFSSPDEPLDGLIDDVKIFDRAVDAAEIAFEYDAGGVGKCTPPLVPRLVFVAQPHDAIAGQDIGPIVLKVLDPAGDPLPGWVVNVALGNSPCASATLTGSGAYVAGATGEITLLATSIDAGGWDYTIEATTSWMGDPVTAISQPFNLIGFCETSSMTTPRVGASATRLADGRVLVVGGVDDSNTPLASAEIFDPYSGTWSLTGSMSGSRSLHTANFFRTGDDWGVFVAGGTSGALPATGSALDTTEIFDPTLNGGVGGFSPGPALNVPRMGHAATTRNDNIILVSGGRSDAGDPAYLNTAISYSVGPYYPLGTFMITGRDSHTASLLADRRVLVAGGLSAPGNYLGNAEIGPNFASTYDMSSVRLGHTATTLADGRVLVAGGSNGINALASAEIFDPLDGAGMFGGTDSMYVNRHQHAAATLPNGNVLVSGGRTSVSGPAIILNVAEFYDPTMSGGAGAFDRTDNMGTARWSHTMTELYDGRILVTGGYGPGSGAAISSAEIYWPINGEVLWTRQIGTPDDERGYNIAVDGSGVYVAGSASPTFPGTGGADYFIGRFDRNGNQVWMLGFGGGDVDLEDISVHGSGLYIVGTNYGGLPGPPGPDAFVRKYDLNGTEVWTRVFGTDDYDDGRGVEVDDSGVYVVGYTQGAFPGFPQGDDVFIRKYDVDGNEVWTRQFGTLEGDFAAGISIHGSSVYVGGKTWGEFPGQTNLGSTDAFVAKFGTDGSGGWIRQYGTTEEEEVGGISAHSSGVYLFGNTDGTFPGETKIGSTDAFVGKWDFEGNNEWTSQFGSVWISGNAVSVDDSGVYVGGEVQYVLPGQMSPGDDDAFACKFDFDGNVVWNKQFGAPVEDRVRDIALDEGSIYLIGEAEGSIGGQIYSGENDVFIIEIAK
ncbi:kelch repeat-containing protein [Acidobacteriota bacterium]